MTAPALHPGTDPRHDVLARLAAGLRGPRRVRADLLAELRDGLEDATAALEAEGLQPHQARQQAVAEFGDPDALVGELQAELTAVQARRTALLVAVVSPIVSLAWDLGYPALMRDYWMRGGQPSGSLLLGPLNQIQDIAVRIAAPLLLLSYLAIVRRTTAPGRVTLAIGLLAGGLLAINLITSGLMTALNPSLVSALRGNLPGLLLLFGSLSAMALLIWSTIRTVRLVLPAPRPVPRRE
jgi:hypothetical protein